MVKTVLYDAGYLEECPFDYVVFIDLTVVVDIKLNEDFSVLKEFSQSFKNQVEEARGGLFILQYF